MSEYRYCPGCASPLASIEQIEDGGPKTRLRCAVCGFTHWNNPTPVLAAVVECTDRDGMLLLARNVAWPAGASRWITASWRPARRPKEGWRARWRRNALTVDALSLIGVYDFQRLNQVIIAYHAAAHGEVRLSPELAEYRLFKPQDVKCWAGWNGLCVG